MNKNASVTMAAAVAVAGILTLAVLTMATQHQAFAYLQGNQGSSHDNNNKQKDVAIGGNGGSGGAGGAGGEGGHGGKNIAEDTGSCCCKDGSTKVDQKANGGDSNGGHGGNANGGDART
jgi:hypothetical protein